MGKSRRSIYGLKAIHLILLDSVGPSAGLPPIGAGDQMDKMIAEALRMANGDDRKTVKEEEFKKTMAEIMGSIMMQLEGSPISVSSNSVVHEPLTSTASSTLLPPRTTEESSYLAMLIFTLKSQKSERNQSLCFPVMRKTVLTFGSV